MNYKAPLILFNAHLETIYPSLIRRVATVPYERERISTPDDDFLDLDWIRQGSNKLLVISHGLEGNSKRPYVRGLARAARDRGFDVVAWNFRGCSGEINRQLRFYHSGATDDLDCVINHIKSRYNYETMYLAGFSLGGNLTLKYLGERVVDSLIRKAVVFSVPMDLHTSCDKISLPGNWIYANRFLKSLKLKVLWKHQRFPELDIRPLQRIRTITQFDDAYTAPIHGYKDAAEYYQKNSSIHFVGNIQTPTLIINALNDPFLSSACFPTAVLKGHPVVRIETPTRGGHVGFAQFRKGGIYWSEDRALRFLEE